MNAKDTMRKILERESLSTIKTSLEMGHGRAYLNTILSEGNVPKTSTLAAFCEVVGYELVVRSKDDGFEFVIDE